MVSNNKRPPRIQPRKNKKSLLVMPSKLVLLSLAAIVLSFFYKHESLPDMSIQLTEEGVIAAWTEGTAKPSANILHVDRIPLDRMNHGHFHDEYQDPRRPLILTGAYADSPLLLEQEWGWQALHDKYGDAVTVETKIPRVDSPTGTGCNTGTGLCQGRPIRLGDLLEAHFLKPLDERDSRSSSPPYAHDVSLIDTLPDMHKQYRKLSYFGENMILPSNNGKDRWPSLYLGARGTQTGLHVEAMGMSSTMAVFRGRKQFVLFDSPQGPKLCMDRPLPELEYGMDALRPNFGRCPSARDAVVWFANVTAGDILYVPGSFHHAEWNVQDSLGIAQNFLTVDDYQSIMESQLGYAINAKRQLNRKERRPQIEVPFDFLAIRDFFRLLGATNYLSNWRDGPLFWEADKATESSFNRLVGHLRTVLADEPNKAWRPAFYCNTLVAQIALQSSGAWECLSSEAKKMLITKDINELVYQDLAIMLQDEFERNATCNPTMKQRWTQMLATVDKAIPLLDLETGLSRELWI